MFNQISIKKDRESLVLQKKAQPGYLPPHLSPELTFELALQLG